MAAGATTVFQWKSGTVTEPAALNRALAAVQAGDVLLMTTLDRLAHSTRDLLNTLDALAKRGAGSVRCVTPGPTQRRRMAGRC